jgi:hypothetical protein
LGAGTNNYEELMSLELLMAFALEHNFKVIKVYGGSKNVINLINGSQRCTNIRLANIVVDIKSLQMVFYSFTCHHVYRERNEEVDQSSKEGSHMELGHWNILEYLNDHFQEQQKNLHVNIGYLLDWTTICNNTFFFSTRKNALYIHKDIKIYKNHLLERQITKVEMLNAWSRP